MAKKFGQSINERQKLILSFLQNSPHGATSVEIDKHLLSHGHHTTNCARDISEIRIALGFPPGVIKVSYIGVSDNGAHVYKWVYHVPEPHV